MQEKDQTKSEVESQGWEKMVRPTFENLEQTVKQSEKKAEILTEEVECKRAGPYDAKQKKRKLREFYLSVLKNHQFMICGDNQIDRPSS